MAELLSGTGRRNVRLTSRSKERHAFKLGRIQQDVTLGVSDSLRRLMTFQAHYPCLRVDETNVYPRNAQRLQ